MERLLDFLLLSESAVFAAGGVFVRISALAFLLPGIGERTIPVRVKLGGALAFAVIVWPAVATMTPPMTASFDSLGYAYAAEAMIGLLLGLSLRFFIYALQTAGTLIAQSLSIAQAFGAGIAPEPEATMGTILTVAAIALALSLGLHVKVAAILIESYSVLPFGQFPIGADMAAWSTARASHAFSLAVQLAIPFILVAFMYNLALGAINRAMPQLMVAFIGMPAITWLGLVLMLLVSSASLLVWIDQFEAELADPLGVRR